MANLTRYDPYDVARSDLFDDVFERLVPTFFQPAMRGRTANQQWNALKMDVYETDNAYELTAEVPGLHKEDIDVTIYGGEVTISAELKEERQAGAEAKPLLGERWHGKMSRTVRLPMEIDDANAKASCSDGLLHLTLPKKASSMATHLQIH